MKKVFAALAALVSAVALNAQIADKLSFSLRPELLLPVGRSSVYFSGGGGSSLEAAYRFKSGLKIHLSNNYSMTGSKADTPLSLISLGTGLGYGLSLGDRVGVAARADAGLYLASWGSYEGWQYHYYGRAGAEAGIRLSPALTFTLGASYTHYLGPEDPFLQGLGASIGLTLNLSGFGGEGLRIRGLKIAPIYPVFYSFYDKNAFGAIDLENGEDGTIRDVRVSFIIKQYMSEPKICASYPAIRKGGHTEVPVYALLREDVLKLTENTKTGAETIVDYTFLGKKRTIRFSETVPINHRNAMTWDDDRRAAAFVSAKDPAVLRYSKFAAGLIRETPDGGELDQNLKIALGLFEGLKLYGLNYVIDPTTPYKELSENQSAVDFLQYPYQTLVYKGGDCDDLSIMFAAILQSVGISSAFITVPGHIYVAFALGADEVAAKKAFSRQEDLIYAEGKVWAPVEITMINDGFLKAWQYGAREWREAGPERRALYPVEEAWKRYEPVGIPGEDTRIVLPPAEGIVKAFKAAVDAVASREIGAAAERIRAELGRAGDEMRQANALGVLYARYGKFSEARKEFEKAAKAGSPSAYCNLGNIAFAGKEYRAAAEYYEKALVLKPANSLALLGLARSRYELSDYPEAAKRFADLNRSAPQLAAAYAYVGTGNASGERASSAAENSGKLFWDE